MSRLLYVWSLILAAKSLLSRSDEVWCGQVLLAEGCWDKGTKTYWQNLWGQEQGKHKHEKAAYSCVCATCSKSRAWSGSIAHTAPSLPPKDYGCLLRWPLERNPNNRGVRSLKRELLDLDLFSVFYLDIFIFLFQQCPSKEKKTGFEYPFLPASPWLTSSTTASA